MLLVHNIEHLWTPSKFSTPMSIYHFEGVNAEEGVLETQCLSTSHCFQDRSTTLVVPLPFLIFPFPDTQ